MDGHFIWGERDAVDEVASGNVCIRCGAAHVAEWLKALGVLRRGWLWRRYRCPDCGASLASRRD